MNVDKRKMILIATAVIGLAVGAMVVEKKIIAHKHVVAVTKTM